MADRKPAASRRREIADAALKVIAEQGLGRFTAQAIAREVGLSDAALFRHFATKEAIVEAAIERVEEILFAEFPPRAADPIDRLGEFFRQRAALVRGNPGVARLVVSDELARAASPAGVARVRGVRRRSVGFVRGCIEEAEAGGLLDEGLDPVGAAVVVLGALFALGHARALADAADAAGDSPARTWAVLERLLRGPARARRRARVSNGRVPRRPAGRGTDNGGAR